jgi:hypothetical protein
MRSGIQKWSTVIPNAMTISSLLNVYNSKK